MVEACHDKAVTTICSIATVKNTQQSTSSGSIKNETKRQRRVLIETAMGITVMATSMTVTGMAVTAHIPHLVL
eukprot:15016741-Ditylum_brightwellii.AAC.1